MSEAAELRKMIADLQKQVSGLAKRQKAPCLAHLERTIERVELQESLAPYSTAKFKHLGSGGSPINHVETVEDIDGHAARAGAYIFVKHHQQRQGDTKKWIPVGLPDFLRGVADGDIDGATNPVNITVWPGANEITISAYLDMDPSATIPDGSPVYISYTIDNSSPPNGRWYLTGAGCT